MNRAKSAPAQKTPAAKSKAGIGTRSGHKDSWPSVAPLAAPHCACGGSCPRCRRAPSSLDGIALGDPHSALERNADRVARELVRAAAKPPMKAAKKSATKAPAAARPVKAVKAAQAAKAPAAKAPSTGGPAAKTKTSTKAKPKVVLKTKPTPEAKTEELELQPIERGPQFAERVDSKRPSLRKLSTPVRRFAGGYTLPTTLRSAFEAHAGVDLGAIRLHADPSAAALAADVGARAFALGTDIVFAAGAYDPSSTAGVELIAHEVAHVLQQSARPSASAALPAWLHDTIGAQPELLIQRQFAPPPRHAAADDPPPPAGQTADDTDVDRAIEWPKAGEKNYEWWTSMQIADLHIIRDLDPEHQPRAWANKVLGAQQAMRVHHVLPVEGADIKPDGILGPRTFLALRRIAQNAASPSRAGIQALGFDLDAIRDAEAAATRARAYARIPEIVVQTPLSVLGENAVKFYDRSFSTLDVADRDRLDQLLFGGPAPQNTRRADRIELLKRFYGQNAQHLDGTVAVVRLRRDFVAAEIDVARIVQQDPSHNPNGYFRFTALSVQQGAVLEEFLGAVSAAQNAGRRLSGQPLEDYADTAALLVGQKSGIAPNAHEAAAILVAIYLPPIDDATRAAIVSAYQTKDLPPSVKDLITRATQGKELTAADRDALFGITRKIEQMPVGQASDFASKVTSTSTDLKMLEAALDKYIADAAVRDRQAQERQSVYTKLLGAEEFYKAYRFILLGGGGAILDASQRERFDRQAPQYGFASLAEFEQYIEKFEDAFEAGAASIATDLLSKFAGKLHRESARYQDPVQLHALHQQLGGMRASFAEFETNARVWNAYAAARQKANEQRSIPGQGHIQTSDYTDIAPDVAEEARKKAEAAKATSKAQFEAVAKDHPIFQEEGLPDDKKFNKLAVARASESQLGAIVQAQITLRMGEVEDAKTEIEGKPALIYKMDKLMPQFFALQGIRPGSIHDEIIQAKMRSDFVVKLVKGIALAIVGIALAVISFGAATPAIIAAGAAIAGASLGVYSAYESYQDYVEEKGLANVGFAKDPSIVWLVISVVGAAVDMGMAARAIGKLGPAAKVLAAGGELADFNKAVRALEQANEIESRIARAAEKAAAARKSLSESTAELGKALSKAYSLPGPLTDPEVYKALIKMARDAIKTKAYDIAKFLEEVRLARVTKKLGSLTTEELAKVKQAWSEAKALEEAENAIEAAEKAGVGNYTTKIEWGIQKGIDARPHTSIKGAFWGRRTPQANPRVDAFELKINPNNESFFLPHPQGGLVQFENLVGTAVVQDGKLVIQARSMYHVADMPPFAARQILAEAERQVAAAGQAGMRIEWLVSDSKALQQLTTLFTDNNIPITVLLFAE